jgi:hypothetical protein
MHILLTDETNRKPTPAARFFVYGGLLIDVSRLSEMDAGIASIRREAGFRAQDDFKFGTHTRPKQVSFDAATEAKREVIALCTRVEAKFIAYVALHEIIKGSDPDDQVLFAANTVISQFNKYLRVVANDDGICIVDNLPVKRSWQYLSEKFTLGLNFGGQHVPVDRIKLFAATCNNASHMSSAMDIVLGTFRYCINKPENVAAASEMMRSVVELMWHEQRGQTILATERGLVMRPVVENIQMKQYRDEYHALIQHINSLLAGVKRPS